MSVGFPVDKGTIDQRAAGLAWQLRSTFEQVAIVKAWLDSQTDTQLGTSGIGYGAAEITTLRNSYTALSLLGQLAHGQIAQPGAQPTDFFADAKNLLGAQ